MSGCYFAIAIDGQEIPFKLPIKWEPLWIRAQKGETKYIKDKIQAQRVAWRQVLRWIEAQLALIDIEMADFKEVFLPYAILKTGGTFYEAVGKNPQLLLGGGCFSSQRFNDDQGIRVQAFISQNLYNTDGNNFDDDDDPIDGHF